MIKDLNCIFNYTGKRDICEKEETNNIHDNNSICNNNTSDYLWSLF